MTSLRVTPALQRTLQRYRSFLITQTFAAVVPFLNPAQRTMPAPDRDMPDAGAHKQPEDQQSANASSARAAKRRNAHRIRDERRASDSSASALSVWDLAPKQSDYSQNDGDDELSSWDKPKSKRKEKKKSVARVKQAETRKREQPAVDKEKQPSGGKAKSAKQSEGDEEMHDADADTEKGREEE